MSNKEKKEFLPRKERKPAKPQLYTGEIEVTHAIPVQIDRGLLSASDRYNFEGDDPEGTRDLEISEDKKLGSYRDNDNICLVLAKEYETALSLSDKDEIQKRAFDYTIAINLGTPPHKEDPREKAYLFLILLDEYERKGMKRIKEILTGGHLDEDSSEKTAIAFQKYVETSTFKF